jgi:hypothetical protein
VIVVSRLKRKTSWKRGNQSICLEMMFQFVLAYLFAAGMGVAVVYLARLNRERGWRRPAPRWFGVELEAGDTAAPAALAAGSDAGELLPQLLQLNRELAAHGTPVRPEVESPEIESSETPEHALIRRV